ncbi:tRNA guanosine-2'-O-methyltransferase TRM11 [Microsporum canis CBS 113480]|uniref:tRNA (guanine(10)-N(2))-methyltransferase n=1 Tax=Arthroderma otae (strain ATCC MYA-4605 / CBS 113480) TaxID=554155 RepID=C5FU68_ARTOC|nr:tRNA guanosine-2'-O-methyltransferase TRM11 [Microsporum canis CBS 113480]EEQ33452.1 tRNA guanosine-2'-O-methyltransferase TRM11 [Microsporum canis CBS 113480]
MVDYLIRFAQSHESFRKAEIEALASLVGVKIEFLVYHDNTPFCVVTLENEDAARALMRRSILAKNIYELWGQGDTYDQLRADVRRRTESRWPDYKMVSFKFGVDTYASTRNSKERNEIIDSFAFLAFEGPIKMIDAEEEFCVFEEFSHQLAVSGNPKTHTKPVLNRVYLGRWVTEGGRVEINRYDLKKRCYISTTSMDAELSLISANMTHAAPGKLFYDPFVGTGSFLVAAAHFGAITCGSDIDGRSFRGKETEPKASTGVIANFKQYGLESKYLDTFTSDLTNTPIRNTRIFDGIICDPPYGVREGLRVLGHKDESRRGELMMYQGVPSYKRENYIFPKRPYGFEAMLDDILDFAAHTLVINGRLSLWMPTANEDEVELEIPSHPCLEHIDSCVQPFNKWSRRLLVYRRLPDSEVSSTAPRGRKEVPRGLKADDLNPFRRKYFESFPVEENSNP